MNAKILDLVALVASLVATALALVGWRRATAAAARATGTDDDAPRPRGLWRMIVGPLAQSMRPTSQVELERLTTRLQNAGRRGRDDVDRFLEEKLAFQILGLVGGVALLALAPSVGGLFLLAICMLIGLLGADKLLGARITERQAAVGKGLPSAVDLLVTCLDAGLSLEQAVARVSKDLAHSDPTLAEELHLTASEFEAGVAMPDALRRLARRVGIDDLSALCGVIAQASSLGAPIAQTLREYAVSSRKQRIAILEERAGKLSTQLTIPLALCLLPSALLVILGPAVVQLVHALK